MIKHTSESATRKTDVPALVPVVRFWDGDKYDQRDKRVVYGESEIARILLSGLGEGLTFASEV